MSETENVTGDENMPETSQSSVPQENLHEDATSPVTGSSDLGDEVGAEIPESTVDGDVTEKNIQTENEKNGFDTLGLPPKILEAVERVGFTTPSPIQASTIPTLMEGRDVVGLAQTGTGKTAAFALPALSRLDPNQRTPQVLVLAPTRELALQVADSFETFAKQLGGVSVLPIYGGAPYGAQLSGLRRGAQVVVGTPGRVIDHLAKGSLDLSGLRFLVLDEADEMLNMGFQEDVERILSDTPDDRQVALFSATMPSAIRRLSKQYLNDAAEITVKSTQRTAENIEQDYLYVTYRNKLNALTSILEVTDFDAMILFVRTKNDTEEVAEKLRERGFDAAAINGDIPQNQRERTVDQLKDGRLDILVATDVAARGLDVERITHVFNYDIPRDTESYVHRIGRTGRAGRHGRAILFVTPREGRLLKNIERATKSKLNEIELPGVDQVNEARKKKFHASITESLKGKQVATFRDLIAEYATENDVEPTEIAAALAAKLQGKEPFLMEEIQEPPRRERRDRNDRGDRGDRRDGFDGQSGVHRPFKERFNKQAPTVTDRNGKSLAVYRIGVGHRQRVRPGAIVGALANEGNMNSRDFGRISIFSEHSLVELPADLPRETFESLDQTRISGKLINIEPDPGAPAGRPARTRQDGDRGGDRGGNRGGGRPRGDRNDRNDRNDRGNRGRNDRGNGGGRFDRDRSDRGGRGSFRGNRGAKRD
ncbi:MAG: DEAD/DEAH box helicase [Corynebacterium sp.]|uniref:DEAD/DEAH box helicase n=1 Tax=unclassified Corynebacterium TaxID=2624378 RepID=UPI0026490B0D|nr:DEAD/DEAH box helicase [Corynebacterium sp.]MDN5581172.1 DEAD/DEAH box helicase [Corynebacterium sp.]MDN5718701.1 DEAD/DEAH box helicase [Corynebacterium sp.]